MNSEIVRRTLVQYADNIVESNINPIDLARELYSQELISESVYKNMRDRESRETSSDRLDRILDVIKDHVKHDVSAFTTFLDILRDDGFNQQELADKIMSKYKGIIHYEYI